MVQLSSGATHQKARSSLLIISVETRHVPLFQLNLPEYNIRELVLKEADLSKVNFVGERADLVIIDCVTLNDSVLLALEHLVDQMPVPILVFAFQSDEWHGQQAMRAGASACIVDGLHEHRIRSLIAIAKERYQITAEMSDELKRTKDSLAARKLIERAKGYLMDQKGLSESDAYALMRKQAMTRAVSLKEVAENIINVSDLLKG